MNAFGARAGGLRLERMKSSPRWSGEGFRNVHPILPRLRDPNAEAPSIRDFLCGGERRKRDEGESERESFSHDRILSVA